MKARTLLVAGAAASMALVPALAAHAGVGTGCATTAPSVLAGGQVGPTLPDGGQIFAQGTQVPPSGSVGITGPSGYLYASGSASGGSIQGTTKLGGQIPWTSSTANGSLNVSSSPGICIGVAGHSVSAP